MSPDLIAFLKAWHDWATSGAPDREPFSRGFGLCSNLANMFRDEHARWVRARRELFAMFGEEDTPFGCDYGTRARARTQHECPKRLAWVRERLVEAGELA